MAKNKVINTVLTLRDNMSKGMLGAAQNAKKAGAQIDNSMIQSTRRVIAFKNRAVSSMQEFAKKSVLAAGAAVSGLTAAFLALDGATEEYRIAQGKLQTAFDASGFSADAARKSYRSFYAILGDTDTATEASQLLAKLAQSEQDVSTWTRIAAGVSGTFGDSLPIEGLIESANETAKVGEVTGTLADALNWAGIMEDDFNNKLASCGSESERNKLIMDTLAQTYEGAAQAFYENNKQVVNARRNQATLQEVTSKLGNASSALKNQLWELFGAMEDGTVRPGSALEWLYQKADQFSSWVSSVDLSSWTARFDEGFAAVRDSAGRAFDWIKTNVAPVVGALKDAAVEAFGWAQENVLPKLEGLLGKLADAFEWVAQNMDKVGPILEGLVKLWAASKVAKFGTDVLGAGSDLWEFGKTALNIGKTNIPQLASSLKGGLGKALDAGLKLVDKFGTGIVKVGGFCAKIIGKVAGVGKALLGLATAHPVIAAIVAAAGLIIANWDKIKPFLEDLWEKAKDIFKKISDWISEKFGAILEVATKVKNFFVDKFVGAINAVKDAFNWVKDAVSGVIDKVKEFLGMDTTKEIRVITSYETEGGQNVGGWQGNTGGGGVDSDGRGRSLAGNALGTSYWRGGVTRVNERGGEILNLPSGTQIIPHDVSARMAGGPQVTVNVTVQGNVIGNRQYADELGETIVQRILRALDNM